jgi:hypothetical protein
MAGDNRMSPPRFSAAAIKSVRAEESSLGGAALEIALSRLPVKIELCLNRSFSVFVNAPATNPI